MVGDRQRIDAEVADALVSRLHAAGIELHGALALPLSAEAQGHVESAIEEIDRAIHLIRVAATDPPKASDPSV